MNILSRIAIVHGFQIPNHTVQPVICRPVGFSDQFGGSVYIRRHITLAFGDQNVVFPKAHISAVINSRRPFRDHAFLDGVRCDDAMLNAAHKNGKEHISCAVDLAKHDVVVERISAKVENPLIRAAVDIVIARFNRDFESTHDFIVVDAIDIKACVRRDQVWRIDQLRHADTQHAGHRRHTRIIQHKQHPRTWNHRP